MAEDRYTSPGQAQRPGGGGGTLMRKMHEHAPNSAQVVGFLTLVISGGILLVLTGLTATATLLGLIFFLPLVVLTSPIWVPVVTVVLMGVGGLLSMCGFGVAVVAGLSWIYNYIRGRHPPGSQRLDYARTRLATHVKDYARDYGAFLHNRGVKDAAPGA